MAVDIGREISRCNRCGFCQAACPVFRATGHESGVARGRIDLLKAVLENRLSAQDALEQAAFNCLLCASCTTHCFPAIPTAELMVEARKEYIRRMGRKRLHRILFDHLLPYPQRLRAVARAASLGTSTGLSDLAAALGLLRIFGHDFPKSHRIALPLPERTFRDARPPGLFPGHHKDGPRIAFFVGCGVDLLLPDVAEATFNLLRRKASEVSVLDNVCCGLPAWTYGDIEAARRLAEKNLERLLAVQPDVVVTDCSSCASFLKRYPSLFEEQPVVRERASAATRRVRDFVEWAADWPLSASRVSPHPTIVTYHDPCHAVRGQGLAAEPREVLRNLPGLAFREMTEADTCCGGAGSYTFRHFEIARKVLGRKLDHLEKTQARILVTSCPSCILQLRYGVRTRQLAVRVCHLSELLASAGPAPCASGTQS